jgi:DNA repair protein RadD
MQLRHYQSKAVDAAIKSIIGGRNPVLCLPTGSGKSLVIAELCRIATKSYNSKILVLQHRKELIEQNADKIRRLIPEVDIGIYSAGLNSKQSTQDVVVAGIQSLFRNPSVIGDRDLIIIDECHLVPLNGKGMYKSVLDHFQGTGARTVGLTATPYRTGEGKIVGDEENYTFDEIAYTAMIMPMIEEGFLCKLVSSEALGSVDTSNLNKRMGEFVQSEMEQLFERSDIRAAVREMIFWTASRHSIMVFATSIFHAETLRDQIRELQDDRVEMITGNTPDEDRAEFLKGFRDLSIRWLINVDVLTTGFDAPVVDAVCILRATASPGLYSQMVGRGLRVHESKTDCLVLDFGENIRRHGAIDRVKIKKQKWMVPADANDDPELIEEDEEDNGEKLCPQCNVVVQGETRYCECGFEFEIIFRHQRECEKDVNILGETAPKWFDVRSVNYRRWQKEGKLATLRVDYDVKIDGKTSLTTISEWVCFDHEGYARGKANSWWRKRSNSEPPEDVAEAIDMIRCNKVSMPSKISAQRDGDYWTIKDVVVDKSNQPDSEDLEDAPF